MAQGQLASGQLPPMPGTGPGNALTAEELYQIQQCEKLVHLRDEVLSGNHPRIKPPHLAAKQNTPSTSNLATPTPMAPATTQPAPDIVNGNGHVVDNMRSFQANLQRPPAAASPQGASGLSNSANLAAPAAAVGYQFGSSKAEINPILLEKSDDLIKAEIRLQRVRLERSLREQVDQRRASTKAALQAPEPLADFGLADVLSKALALVQSTAAQSTDETAANASASSDSFDDNTFYSSQHDTPEPPPASNFLDASNLPNAPILPNGSEDEQMRDSSPYEPELDPPTAVQPQAVPAPEPSIPTEPRSYSLIHQNPAPTHSQNSYPGASLQPSIQNGQNNSFRIPGLQTIRDADVPGARGGGEAIQSEESRNLERQEMNQIRERAANRQRLDEAFAQQTPPVIRAHNLSPIAPQPAHVSPLAVARQPPAVQEHEPQARRATPPQVAALRKGPSAATSPESSPQGTRPGERKKGKKKKRKADKQAGEAAAASPFIKTEPRSPSPFLGPAEVRPAKRQRQTHPEPQRQQDGPTYDEIRYEQPVRVVDDGFREHYQLRSYRDERGPVRNDMQGNLQRRHESQPVVVAAPRYGRDYYAERPAPGTQFHHPASPVAYPVEYGAVEEVRVVHPASHGGFERPYRDAPVQYREPREGLRMSIRPGMDGERSRSPVIYERPMSVMPPPRAPPARILLDESGREYMDPPRPAAIRQSVAPAARAGEPEVIYERPAPLHAGSRRPDSFEENSILYRRQSPPYVPQRRVVTQPEPAGPDYRAYREREYSVRPMVPPGNGYAPSRPHPESRLVTEPQYIARAATVRPVGEGIRYEVSGAYDRRVGGEPDRNLGIRAASAMPTEAPRYEAPPQGYERRVVEPQYLRAASVRPAEPVRYEYAGGYGERVGSVRPEHGGREYAASVHPEARREIIQPSTEGPQFGGRLVEAGPPIAHQEYRLRPSASYYDRPLVRGGEEIVYLDPPSRPDAYQHAQRSHP